MSKIERTILFYDLEISSVNKTELIIYRPLADLMALVESVHKSVRLTKDYYNGSQTWHLADIEMDKKLGVAKLLISNSDKNAADPVFTNPKSNQRRKEPKKSGEGLEKSVHILLNLNEIPKKPNHYVCLIEFVSGFNSHRIESFINHILKIITAHDKAYFSLPHPNGSKDSNGKPTLIHYRNTINLTGLISNDFAQDLEAGELKGIELITEDTPLPAWDMNDKLLPQKRVVSLLPQGNSFASKKWASLKTVFTKASKTDYQKARIIFKTANKKQTHIDVYTDTATLVDNFKYTKKERIILDHLTDDAFEKLHPEITKKMGALL